MSKNKPIATPEQLEIAKEFHIPKSQAHTINLKKAAAYKEYLASEEAKLEQFLNSKGGL
jgi:hypothetical protein